VNAHLELNAGGIVLCGGKSTRMGRPKLSLPFGPETMLQRVVRILIEVVTPVVVVAAKGQELPELPEGVLVTRDKHDSLGPLAGLAKGLAELSATTKVAYVTSCDAPLLKIEFVRTMIGLLNSHDIVIPADGAFHHPLAAVYRTALVDKVEALISAGRLRPVSLMNECDARIVSVDELRKVDARLDSLRNTNTIEEYRQALADAGLAEPSS
jgi:molybdopterin-guanine dinucleotide biosynthesis protein A